MPHWQAKIVLSYNDVSQIYGFPGASLTLR